MKDEMAHCVGVIGMHNVLILSDSASAMVGIGSNIPHIVHEGGMPNKELTL